MKFHKRVAILALAVIAALTVSTTTVFADEEDVDPPVSSDVPAPDEPIDTPTPDDPADDPSVEPAPPVDSTPDNTGGNSYDDPSYNNNNNYGNTSGDYYDTPSRSPIVVDRENEFYQPGTRAVDSTQPVVDNKLYDASLTGDSNEMNADDWDLALAFDDVDSGNDFNFIKNNDSKDDSLLYQLMLFGGVLLITVSIFGIIMIIVMTVRTSKKNKAILAKAGVSKNNASKSSSKNDTTVSHTEDDTSKYDTSEIDLSKYDKYL